MRLAAYIFVQPELKRGDLKPLVWENAEERAKEARKFYEEILGIDPARVQVLMNLSKA